MLWNSSVSGHVDPDVKKMWNLRCMIRNRRHRVDLRVLEAMPAVGGLEKESLFHRLEKKAEHPNLYLIQYCQILLLENAVKTDPWGSVGKSDPCPVQSKQSHLEIRYRRKYRRLRCRLGSRWC